MTAVVFPGQGAQKPGMGQSLYEEVMASREVFESCSQATRLDLPELCFASSEEELRKTENAQLALYTVSLAAWAALNQKVDLGDPVLAGHSVGEYAAVVASGALDVATGAKLVRKRGELMASVRKDRPGTMAAVIGLDREALERVCNEVGDKGVCVIANDNSPGQLVISGDIDAVQAASALAGERGARRVLPLNVSGAFHSPLMEEPAKAMGEELSNAPFGEQKLRVVANVTAEVVEHGTNWPALLEAQLRSPVRWTESVQRIVALGAKTIIECGVGEVLIGLARRIEPELRPLRVCDIATLDDTVARLEEVPA